MSVSHFLRVLQVAPLMIDRSQIVEITNKKIVVKEATVQETAPMPAVA
jgi:hypothetical protein